MKVFKCMSITLLFFLLQTTVQASLGENDIHLIKINLPNYKKAVVHYWMKLGKDHHGNCEWYYTKNIESKSIENGETYFVDGDEIKELTGLTYDCAAMYFQLSSTSPIVSDKFYLVKNNPGTAYILSSPFSASVTLSK